MSKDELETNKKALELLLSENGDQCIDYKAQIAKIEQELKDLGKIELPPVVFDDIYAVHLRQTGRGPPFTLIYLYLTSP